MAATQALEAGSLKDVVRCGERALACGAEGVPLGELAAMVAEALSYAGDDLQGSHWAEAARERLTPVTDAWWIATQVLTISCIRDRSPRAAELADEIIARIARVAVDARAPGRRRLRGRGELSTGAA